MSENQLCFEIKRDDQQISIKKVFVKTKMLDKITKSVLETELSKIVTDTVVKKSHMNHFVKKQLSELFRTWSLELFLLRNNLRLVAGCSQRQERDDKAVVLSFVDFCFVDQILRRVVLVIPDSTRPNVFLKCLLH